MSTDDAVIDTVVLRYFLFAGCVDLLLTLLGSPLKVPRVVFDPDDTETTPVDAASEVTVSIRFQRAAATDSSRHEAARAVHAANASALEGINDLVAMGKLESIDLTEAELERMAGLMSRSGCRAFGLKFPLHAGEAACVAVATFRGHCLVTDDSDALTALHFVNDGAPYERIRRLLVRAADEGHITQDEANELHRLMTDRGFRDKEPPFQA